MSSEVRTHTSDADGVSFSYGYYADGLGGDTSIEWVPGKDAYRCSPNGAAHLLDMHVKDVWRELVQTGKVGAVYTPDGKTWIEVPRRYVINPPAKG